MDDFGNWFRNEVFPKMAPKLKELKEIGLDLGETVKDQEDEEHQMREGVEHILLRVLDRRLHQKASRRRDLLEEAEVFGLQLIELARTLDVPNIEPDENLRVMQLRDYLKLRVMELEKLHDERAAKLAELRCQEKKLADFLGEQLIKIPANVLTQNTLDDVERNTVRLHNEKEKRIKSFGALKEKILSLMVALEHAPKTPLERDIVSADEGAFLPTEVNMNAVGAIVDEFERDVKRNEEEATKIRDYLRDVWDALQVETSDRDGFLAENVGHRPSTVRALREELKRCKDLKTKNARQYVERMRSLLENLWDRCYFSAVQRKAFVAFKSDVFTEELVDLHDSELQRLKAIREEGKELYTKFEKRAELWTRMQQLEGQAGDPKRLMNRGGQLLKEEKERKRLQALIPKLETDLEADVSKWESEKGRQFLVYGKQIMEFVRDQWDVYQQEKENEKLARHAAKVKLLEDEMVNGSRVNTSKRIRVLGTPVREPQSKLAKLTPLTCNAILTRAAASSAIKSTRKPPIVTSKTTSRKLRSTTRRSQCLRPRKLESSRLAGTPALQSLGGDSTLVDTRANHPTSSFLVTPNVSTYSQFTRHIDQRCQADTHSRSSVLPPKSPGTPRRYRDRLGLPFLL